MVSHTVERSIFVPQPAARWEKTTERSRVQHFNEIIAVYPVSFRTQYAQLEVSLHPIKYSYYNSMTLATDQKATAFGLSATSTALLRLRETVFERWLNEVRAHVPAARDAATPILVNTLPMLYDNLAEALTPEYPRQLATSQTTLGAAHGGERARMTDYGSDQVVHEYHLFRDVILEVCCEEELTLTAWERAAIDQSIDTAVRESVRAFEDKQKELRNRMAASLSHDMRTPLSVIHSGAKLIGMSNDLASSKHAASKIEEYSLRLVEMVDQLIDALTFHQGAALPLSLSEFDVYDVVKEVADTFNTGTSIVEVTGQSVCGHWCRSSLRRAIENLVSNAFKYGDGDTVKVKADASLGRVMISVHNTGVPIPPDQRDSIFQYLRREHTSSQPGWGIGLPFVQSVAESHGGSTALDSSTQAGTTFVIDLPIDCRSFVS